MMDKSCEEAEEIRGETKMKTYLCDDGNAEIEIDAESPEEAAQEYVDGSDWGDDGGWVKVYVQRSDPAPDNAVCAYEGCEDEAAVLDAVDDPVCQHHSDYYDRRAIKIALPVSEPDCAGGHDHDWRSPRFLGGCDENPGVWGHGGGVIITEVCAHCGTYRDTDTWAQDRCDGEQGLESVSYREADEDSRAWIAEQVAKETEIVRYGTFGPIVWDTITKNTRYATQYDMDHLPCGDDLAPDEESLIDDD